MNKKSQLKYDLSFKHTHSHRVLYRTHGCHYWERKRERGQNSIQIDKNAEGIHCASFI